MFNFLKNCQTVFQRACTILHFHRQSRRVLVLPHTLPTLGMVSLFNFSHSNRHLVIFLTLVLIGIFLTNDAEHVFTSALCHPYIFLGEVYVQIFGSCFIGLFSYYWVGEFFMYFKYKPFIRYVICNCFLLVCALSSFF